MFKQQLEKDLKKVLTKLGYKSTDIVLSIPQNPKFGEYTTNIPLQLAKQKSLSGYQSADDIAKQIVEKLGHPAYLERLDIAGAGFINFYLKDQSLIQSLVTRINSQGKNKQSKRYLVEYAQPNTHKEFHIGHLRNVTIGESIARILENQGHQVFRVTYGSDIGPPVAKALYGVNNLSDQYQRAKDESLQQKASFLGKAYALGAKEYQKNNKAKIEIDEINKKLYQKEKSIQALWVETKKWSESYFDSIYRQLGTEFDGQIWESEVSEQGAQIVKDNLGKVFIKNQGAIIFPGKKFGLHNRVFINSQGYPTYEAKELGLTSKEGDLFRFDYSLHVVATEQTAYFQVVIKAIEVIDSTMQGKKIHLGYGMVNLTTGKMSSREGSVVTAQSLIDQVKDQVDKIVEGSHLPSKRQLIEDVAIGAIKFYILKYSRTKDIIFDINQSLSLLGDSGPYIQYTFARTQSLLAKVQEIIQFHPKKVKLEDEERQILRLLEYFEYVIEKTIQNFEPNDIASYLIKLAKAYNLFYQKYPILGSKHQGFRIALTKRVGKTIKTGLYLLGIKAPERM